MTEKKKKEEEEVVEGEVVEEEIEKETRVEHKAIVKKEEDKALVPSAENILKLSKALYLSGMFPNVKNEYGALAIIEYGRELGIQPVIALQTMSVISGRICMEAKTMMAMAERNGIIIEILEKTKQISRVRFTKKGKEPFIETFEIKDAERMGFLKKSNWQLYPEEMLFWRCISKGLRAYDPGSILGLYSNEEMLDVGDEFKEQKKEEKPKKKTGPKPKEEPEVPPASGVDEEGAQEELPPQAIEPEKEKKARLVDDELISKINAGMATLVDKYKKDPGSLLEDIVSRVENRFQFTPKKIPESLTVEAGQWVLKLINLTVETKEKEAEEKKKNEEEPL